MASFKGLEIADILQQIRLVIKAAASTYRDKTSSSENSDTLLFKSMCQSIIYDEETDVSPTLETQLKIYDYVMDAAIKGTNISKSWLCRLHSLIFSSLQSRVNSGTIYVKNGAFRAGHYKHLPNKIVWRKGRDIRGAPVKKTSAEMLKFFQELRSKTFLEAHPIFQASYAHYALVAIHPFKDGNGRIARLLAFIFIYRSNFIPTLFLKQERVEYASALRAANWGDFQPFISLVQQRSIESAHLIKNQIFSAMEQV